MLKIKISGNMLRWIKNFLSCRTSRVKIGQHYSTNFTSQNGTPQGSSLSPILFLIMVNDFPTLSEYTSNALFADDCTVWRSGKNLSQIQYHLQNDLNIISDWCKKWGFQINIEKTVGIIFTNKLNLIKEKFSLKIDDNLIKFQNSCKLLGVIFDNHLSWKQHIDLLINKSSRALNILRCISGTSWGSNKDTLLILYKSLILSNLDYCSFTYSNSAPSNLKKLDTIQYKSLLLATGGLKGTALKALLGECAELPLYLRRQQSTLKYLLKLSSSTNNAANKVLNDSKYFQLDIKRNSSFLAIINNFLHSLNMKITSNSATPISPLWSSNNDYVDLTYLKVHNDNRNRCSEQAINNISRSLENSASNFNHLIFVDGSVQSSSKVGAAIYSPTIPVTLLFKLPNRLSVYYAEAYAILQAILYVSSNKIAKTCIISDNLNILKDIKFTKYNLSPHPSILHNIVTSLFNNSELSICLKWLPAHSKIIPIELSDHHAKLAANSNLIPEAIDFTYHEALLAVDDWIWEEWKKDWDKRSSCKYQSTYQLNRKYIETFPSRRSDIIKNRLRLLQSRLNAGLQKIGLHADGNCGTCGVLQDNLHFVLECSDTAGLRNLINSQLKAGDHKWNYAELTTNPKAIEMITTYIIQEN